MGSIFAVKMIYEFNLCQYMYIMLHFIMLSGSSFSFFMHPFLVNMRSSCGSVVIGSGKLCMNDLFSKSQKNVVAYS